MSSSAVEPHFIQTPMTTLKPLPITVAGASGRMGHMLIEAILATDDCRLSGALDIAASPALGQDAGAAMGRVTGACVTSDMHAGLQGSACLIDFTRPEGTLAHLKVCRELGVKAVIGTTGFTDAQKAEIAQMARDIAIVMAPSFACSWRDRDEWRKALVLTARQAWPKPPN